MPYSNRQQWGACLFIAGMELEDISLTFTQFLKVVGLRYVWQINMSWGSPEGILHQ